jgi:hypothetical protein
MLTIRDAVQDKIDSQIRDDADKCVDRAALELCAEIRQTAAVDDDEA